VAALHKSAAIDEQTAALAILVALSAKVLLAWSGRHVKFGISVTLGVLLVAAGAWLGMSLGA
jgi:hypothetical protein